ncbi:unnamed protein product [Cuscuta epithymum]|uniref:Uncharacterized protein n=1 Tax=Cuscuta epithymum TaxID=186058 RepID=A0AAV0GJC5_9ASTE|nr:unnamed protein product [Cuscuta epithymum]
MLLHVLGPKSGYTRGKGNGYGGSAKARLQVEQQQKLRQQQEKITHLQNELEATKKEMEEYKMNQTRTIAALEERLIEMITRKTRKELHDDDDYE